MFFCILYLLSALSISVIAAYFSIIGLATIFPGSITAIIVMGSVLEIGKIVTAVWLHRNWKTAPLAVKSYLSFALLTLMGITSMGIFGFLSRSHIEHQTNTDKALAQVEVINNKITRQNEYVERQKEYIVALEDRTSKSTSTSRLDIDQEDSKIKAITEQMNKDIEVEQARISSEKEQVKQLDQALIALENSSGGIFSSKKKKVEELKSSQEQEREEINKNISQFNANISSFRTSAKLKMEQIEKKITEFRSQSQEKGTSIQPQIEEHSKNISAAHTRIDELETEKIDFSDNALKLEAEVGPVKYVAEAIADFTGKEFEISQAVRIVILILVLVFDPLAILLVIAANISIEKHMPKSNKKYKELDTSIKDLEEKKLELTSIIEEREQNLNRKGEELKVLELAKKEGKEISESNSTFKKELELIMQKIEEKKKEEQIIKESIQKYANKIRDEKQSYQEAASSIELAKQKLESEKENISAEQSISQGKKAEIEKLAEKNKARIQQQEEILQHINSEKEKSATEKSSLEQTSLTLKQEIEARQGIIKKLKDTYQDSINSSNLVDIFKNAGINDMSTHQPGGEKTLSIIDKRDRVHQYLIPKQHTNLPNSYFHEITKELSEVIDPDDLEHEYKILIKKYITFNIPNYNFLT